MTGPTRARSHRFRPAGADRLAGEDLDFVGADEAGVLDACGLGDLEQVPAQRLDVVGDAYRLQSRFETVGQPAVLRGDAGRAGIGVALLGLDTANREHGLTPDVHHVG